MTLHTVALGAALSPTVLQTLINHYLHRKSRHSHPTVHLTYDEGIQVIRQFLYYASKHPVEDIQAFTRQSVPSPHWVRTEPVTIPEEFLSSAANVLVKQLGPKGLVRVGGEKWWQWRGPDEGLKCEWIEMRSHYNEMKKSNGGNNRIMLYVHGGAYFFGSVDTHRYMLQRHARKLNGRVFAPNYRLAPQFPFPCGLQDCMAAYLWLLKSYEPKEIILAGDSAGGGMTLSLLVMMRDQGIPLPAGAILISPWVDLTHSFPSIVDDNPGDYIPPYGFRYKPSAAWPPPNADEILKIKKLSRKETFTAKDVEAAGPTANKDARDTAIRGYTLHEKKSTAEGHAYPGMQQSADPSTLHAEPDNIHVVLEGKTVELKDQIQMYATNQLISHPLVSPILQASLGGLPPLQIISGGGETLRDEQFYVAHKAANPPAYPPGDVYLDEFDPNREILHKYEPTYVQLQIWDDLCHVAPTLSFTRPAKYMFRSIAQFGSWALARAQKTEVEIMDENLISPVSSSESESSDSPGGPLGARKPTFPAGQSVGKAGDPLPAFDQYMIRQRVDKRGHMYHLDPPSSYPVLATPPEKVGAVNPELIRKWLEAKHEWDQKFSKEKLRVQSRRIKEMAHGFQDFEGECPPPSSLAARRAAPGVLPKSQAKKNYGLMLWSGWGSKHDERTMQKAHKAEKSGQTTTRRSVDAGQAGTYSSVPLKNPQPATSGESRLEPTTESSSTGGTAAVTWNNDTEKKQWNGDTAPGRPSEPTSLRPPSQRSGGPILILPGVDNRKFSDENASTRALFHAKGTLPMSSDASLPYLRGRPSSVGGSVAGRSEFMSDNGEDASTVGGDMDSSTVPGTAHDAASTRAVLSAKGVVGVVSPRDSGRISTDTASLRPNLSEADAVPAVGSESRTSTSQRPDMPEREVFKTAQEAL
ncbi:lipase/esterase family protein [Penicillium brasilianum]|uniref:Lipase/esterase family protein n=1 Tax=Penicillium brasilianum TaxID=104259 RepID=A0A1S9RRM9_PENBI|nr:lipase/esterase family protein [Penicillium brasilianum]